jgi:hypothetical protein
VVLLVGHTVQATPAGATEYVPAEQLVHVTSAAVVEKTLRVPAGQVETAVQAVALAAADQFTPRVQLAHCTSAEAEQVAAT